MGLGAVIAIVSLIVIVGVIVFGFWQGLKLKPEAELTSDTINGVTRHTPGGIQGNDRNVPDARRR